ncbi:MAG TPA: hypothetical protein DIU07_12185 [Rhodobacteraceae bacterium]|nr:hypothetical protein [Paracoccaceae bacterium]
MIAFLKRHILRYWAAAPVATLLLAVALAATAVFGVRSAVFWAHGFERIAREQPVAAWMTPGYVALSWHLPREAVIEALTLDPRAGSPRKTLADLAAERNVPVTTLIDALEAAIADHRAAHPPPPGEARSDERSPGDEQSEEPAPGVEGGAE